MDFDQILRDTVHDGRVSRGERQALSAIAAESSPNQLAVYRNKTFAVARQAIEELHPGLALDWLEATLRALTPKVEDPPAAEAFFSPGEACRDRILGLLRAARSTADICVFTITDDAIARQIFEASRRGVTVRIITDDQKAHDKGSDVFNLERSGIDVREDRTAAHMHHKFALIDGRVLINGSYNWTRSAFTKNEENIVVCEDPRLVGSFQRQFDRLWRRLG